MVRISSTELRWRDVDMEPQKLKFYIVTNTSTVSPHRAVLLQSEYRGLSVCHSNEPCKNAWTDPDAVWVQNSGGSKEPCIRWGSRSPHAKGQLLGEMTCPGMPDNILPWAVQKWLNRSKCRLACGLGCPQEACIRSGAHWSHLANTTEPSIAAAMQPFVKLLWPLVWY